MNRIKHDLETNYWIRDFYRLMLPLYRKLPREERQEEGSWQEWQAAIRLYSATEGHYWSHLPEGYNCGRLIDIGCGPLMPARHLPHTELWGVDPNISAYLAAGFPMREYGAVMLPFPAEDMWMVPNDFFHTVVSQNAIDHCDDFEKVIAEIERVAKPDATLRINIPYHDPTATEPLKIDDERVVNAFKRFAVDKITEGVRPAITEALWGTKESD